MSAEVFILSNIGHVKRLALWLGRITFAIDRHWKVTIERIDPRHSDGQRAKYRAMLGEFARHTGYDSDELHEIVLAGKFGTKQVRFREGVLMERPAKRSSDLTRKEMAELIDWLQDLAAKTGCNLR